MIEFPGLIPELKILCHLLHVVSNLPQVHCCDKSGYEVIKNLLTLGVKVYFTKEPITLRLFGYTLDKRYE